MKPSQIIQALPQLLNTPHSPFIWGDPGIGKSDIIREVAAQLKIGLTDLRLSIYDPTDLKGFPTIVGTGKSQGMHFVPPALLPTKGKGILFLDELPAAPPAVQAAAYQLILDRQLGEYKLPPGWHVVAAGNYARNGGVHYTIPAALANRFIHLDMVCSPDDWDDWAVNKGIDPLVRAFIRFRPALLHDMSVRDNQGIAFPTPRSWAFTSNVVKLKMSTAAEHEVLKGTVGEGPATEFIAFSKIASSLPTASEILLSPQTAPVPDSPAAKHAVSTMMEQAATAPNFGRVMEYMQRLDVEYQTAFMANITKHKRELCSTKEHVDWCLKNKDVLGI